jgi:hypothetical protein
MRPQCRRKCSSCRLSKVSNHAAGNHMLPQLRQHVAPLYSLCLAQPARTPVQRPVWRNRAGRSWRCGVKVKSQFSHAGLASFAVDLQNTTGFI